MNKVTSRTLILYLRVEIRENSAVARLKFALHPPSPIRSSIHHAVPDFLLPLPCSKFPACLLPASRKLLHRPRIPSPTNFSIQLPATNLRHRPVAVYIYQRRLCLEMLIVIWLASI